jgi:hypothetical protein
MTAILSRAITSPTRPPTTTWFGAEDFVLRIAGMPIEHAQQLRFPDTTEWADRVIATERDLRREGARIADLLAVLISDPAHEPVRGTFIALRRDIYNNRQPRPAAAAALDLCPPEIAEQVRAWIHKRTAATELVQSGAGVVADETTRRRRVLKTLAGHPRLRAGLILGSPTVDAYLPGYLASGDILNKRQRRLERTLLDYLYRVACKTSPFSSFTGLALGRTDGTGGSVHVGKVDAHWTSHVQLNVAIVGRLIDAIVASEQAFSDLSVALTPGFTQESERFRFVRRSISRGDDTATVSFDMATDSLFFLKRRETLGFLVQLLGKDRLPAAQVVSALAFRTGDVEETCAEYLRYLIGLGLLWLPDLGTDLFAPDPLADFGFQLSSLDHLGWARDAAVQIDRLAALVRSYGATSCLEDRRAILGELRTALARLFADLGREGDSLPVTLLFEDTITTHDLVHADAALWGEQILPSLTRIGSLLEAYEMGLPSRLLLRGFFFARYGRGGRCDDVIGLLHNFAEDIYDEFGRVSMKAPVYDEDGRFHPYQNWLQVPELDAVSAARKAINDRMHEVCDITSGNDIIHLPDDLIDEVEQRMAPLHHTIRPQGFFLQLGGDVGAPEVVLNRPTSGLLFSYSRFTNGFGPDLIERLRAYGRRITGDDAILAEVTGGLNRTNLNVHQPLADYHIVSPAEGSSFPPDRQLPIEDLYVVHDECSDRLQLRSRRLGKEVIPIYLGYLMPTALPEVPRNLLLFSPSGMAQLDLWGGIPERESIDGVRMRPQLRYRNVVLARRAWTMSHLELPGRVSGEDDANWFLKWRRWQQAHHLPDQVFVTLPKPTGEDPEPTLEETGGAGSREPGSPDDAGDGFGRRTKPSYLDFTSLFSIGVFANEIQSVKGVIQMEEMLPTEGQQYVRSAEGHHVCELAVELVRHPVGTREGDL